ncbi:hypothetical protein LBYZC6_53380 [Lacrimispora brassicae]
MISRSKCAVFYTGRLIEGECQICPKEGRKNEKKGEVIYEKSDIIGISRYFGAWRAHRLLCRRKKGRQ